MQSANWVMDLMEEFNRSGRYARRIALAAMLGCAATADAAETDTSFRSLLAGGYATPAATVKVNQPSRLSAEPAAVAVTAVSPETSILKPPSRLIQVPPIATPSAAGHSVLSRQTDSQLTVQPPDDSVIAELATAPPSPVAVGWVPPIDVDTIEPVTIEANTVQADVVAPESILHDTDAASTDVAIADQSQPSALTPAAAIHANRLRELAERALQEASHRYQRHASHSARKYAIEALRLSVAMQDARVGDNEHSLCLGRALDAIRESEDFLGRFGAVDPQALQRMVAVHETDVLKQTDLSTITCLQATEAYLAAAGVDLVAAAGGTHQASDSLVLLGKIEKQLSVDGDAYRGAVALTLQRAAVQITPTNAMAHRELGATLMQQGFIEQSAVALRRSIDLRPNRTAYQQLLEASRRIGDVDTARLCLVALEDPSVPSDIAVTNLSPQAFAASYRSDAAGQTAAKPASARATAAKAVAAKKPTESEIPAAEVLPATPPSPRMSLRSLLPFGRR